MKTINAIIAIAGAAAVGVVAGIMIAPKKGSDTREDIVKFIKARCPLMKKEKLQAITDALVEEIDG